MPSKKKTEKPQSLRTILSRSPDLQGVARQLSVLLQILRQRTHGPIGIMAVSLSTGINGQVMTALMCRGPAPGDESYWNHQGEMDAI